VDKRLEVTRKGGSVMIAHPEARLRVAVTFVSSLVLAAGMLVAAPSIARSSTECHVRNATTGITTASLQKAIAAAAAGDTLRVKGICKGTATIGKRLTIRGVTTVATGMPVLGGFVGTDAVKWVVKLKRGVSATIRDLTIRGGRDASGIQVHGALTLRDVIVRDNGFQAGGGIWIWSAGSVVMNGSTVVKANDAAWGGGIMVDPGATLVMNGTSAIRGNHALDTGGGAIVGEGGTLVMNDASLIGFNKAANGAHAGGGGVDLSHDARLEMHGSSAIRGNTAAIGPGGGVRDQGASLAGVVCAPAADPNVRDNSPDDCFTAEP
jgi:hypothetical protein